MRVFQAGIAALQLSVLLCLQAGAYRTILTHFSQRYPKIPKIDDSFSSSTCIAFDLMSVNLAGGPLHASEAAWVSRACAVQLSATAATSPLCDRGGLTMRLQSNGAGCATITSKSWAILLSKQTPVPKGGEECFKLAIYHSWATLSTLRLLDCLGTQADL